MSENIPESVPTSHDRRSQRPTKRRALSPTSAHSAQLDALFANPDRDLTPRPPGTRNPALPPEIVTNVQGSSAGAGSGEFHVYKASRRREYERLRLMDEEKEIEEKDAVYESAVGEARRKDEERTEKKRREREKARLRKQKGKTGDGTANAREKDGPDGKSKLKPNVAGGGANGDTVAEDPGTVQNGEGIGIVIHDDD